MPKKATDPFIGDIWDALVADKLGPGGHQTGWAETPARIRNRFIRVVRQVMQSGAAFQASMAARGMTGADAKKSRPASSKKAAQKSREQPELLLPLMINMPPREKPTRKTKR